MSMLVLVKEGLEVSMVGLEDVGVFGGIGRVRSRGFHEVMRIGIWTPSETSVSLRITTLQL